jgi:hypothetical protein
MNTINKTKITLTSLATIVAGAVIVIMLEISSVRGASTKPKPPTMTPIPTDILNYEQALIQSLEQDLQGELDKETRHSLETKLQNLYAQVTQRALGIHQLTAMPNKPFIPPTFQVEGQRDLGIIEYPTNPFPSTEYVITNAWQELINGNYVTVFAGALGSNPKQGVIIVQMEAPRQTRQYLTPDQSGVTKITSAKGFRLVVETSDSKRYYFDVPAQRFVSSMGEIVPTITPFTNQSMPTLTATPVSPYP